MERGPEGVSAPCPSNFLHCWHHRSSVLFLGTSVLVCHSNQFSGCGARAEAAPGHAHFRLARFSVLVLLVQLLNFSQLLVLSFSVDIWLHIPVQTVLEEFFTFNQEFDFWYHKRCDETITAYQAKAQRNREVGKLGGRPKANPDETQMVSKDNPNHKPITINHKPKVESTRGSRLSPDFCLTEEWKDFCQQDRPDLNPSKVFDSFKDYWIAKAGQQGVKLDWFATWRNWVRSQNQAPLNKADQVFTTVPSKFDRDPALIAVEQKLKEAVPMPPEIRAAIERLRK